MKKLKYFVLLLLLLISTAIFGAWTPVSQVSDEDIRYADAQLVSTLASTEIYYTKKIVAEERDTDGGAPIYFNTQGFTNACGPLAGTAIVAYYDRYYPNLIPGWESYDTATGKYRSQDSSYVTETLTKMYTLMQTNLNGEGVSESEFKTGLQTYITNQGYSARYTNMIIGGTLNYSACKTALDSNKVIALLIKSGVVYRLREYSDYDMLFESTISGNHIMYAYGYIRIMYYNSTGLYKMKTFLKVSTGLSSLPMAYFDVNSSNLVGAYSVSVS